MPASITDAAGTHAFTYNAAGQYLSEVIAGGILDGFQTQQAYDGLLRRSSFSATRSSGALVSTSYTYDAASRMSTVATGGQSAAYNYLANSSLVSQITFKHNGTPAMTTTKTYDGLNRLASINSAPVVGDPLSYAYQYNAAGQREQVTLANNDIWAYGYNSRGEVISGSKKQGGTTDLLGYQFGYAFDNVGNRISATREAHASTYTANSLNQHTQRTVPGYIHVLGSAKPTATVTVNNESTACQGEAFYKELSVDNTSQPVYQATQVKAVLGADTAEINGNVFVPKATEAFTYDSDGNLLSDGRWIFRWDGENRLVGMETQLSAAATGGPRVRLTFEYDYQSRRISKKIEDWKGSHYQERYTMLFLYEAWNLVAEVLATGTKIRTYVWGNDLGGGNELGGVVGLLFISQYPENRTYATGYDGNGNVVAFFDMDSDGEVSASYEYGPFGEMLKSSGVMSSVIPIRFFDEVHG